jgi:DNA-binding LacI/PurR family transcriptional regulator
MSTPRVSRVVAAIRDQLRSRYASPPVPGTRLPPERELLKRFEVSRPTLRRALDALVAEGLLRRYPGRGTFIAGAHDPPGALPPVGLSVGLVCRSLRTLEGRTWVTAAIDRGFESGVVPMVSITHADLFRELILLRQLLDRHVDGIVIHPVSIGPTSVTHRDEVSRLRIGRATKLVVVGQCDLFPEASQVWYDEVQAGYLATRHLIEAGHRHIAHIAYQPLSGRTEGYRKAMAEAGLAIREGYVLDVATVPHADVSVNVGRNALRVLLSLPKPPTAVFAYWTELAVGVVIEARARGLAVPRQMAAIGVGLNLEPDTQAITPLPISTVSMDMQAIGRAAMELLLTPTFRGEGQSAGSTGKTTATASGKQVIEFPPKLEPAASTVGG